MVYFVEVDLLTCFLTVSELAKKLRVWFDTLISNQFVDIPLGCPMADDFVGRLDAKGLVPLLLLRCGLAFHFYNYHIVWKCIVSANAAIDDWSFCNGL